MAQLRTTSNGSPTINLGIIGLGGGATDMIPAFAQHPHLRLTAAADLDQELLDRFQRDFQGETYQSVADLCQNPNVDAVYIATPNQFHMEHAMLALNGGKHLLLEKPMTLTLEEAETMIVTADQQGVKLAVNVKHSFEPRIRRLRQLVKSGELGPLRMVNFWVYSDWLYRPRTTEELNPQLGGGVTWRQGPHQFDILRTLGGGMVRSVRAMTGFWDENRPVVGCHSTFLEFENGMAATAVYTGHDHFNSQELTFGADEEGNWEADPATYARGRRTLANITNKEEENELKRRQRYGADRPSGASQGRSSAWVLGGPLVASFDRGDVRLTPRGLMVYGDTERWEIPVATGQDGRPGIIDQFYQAIVNDTLPLANGRWGKATLEVLLAVFQSGRERREVFLSHQVELQD